MLSQYAPTTAELEDVPRLPSLALQHAVEHAQTHLAFMREWTDIQKEGHGALIYMFNFN
jgi:hypothetical protein